MTDEHLTDEPVKDGQMNDTGEREPDDDISLPLSATREDRDQYSQPVSGSWDPERYYEEQAERPMIPSAAAPEWKEIPTDSGFKARAITEGAMMVALALLLAFISNYVPVLNVVGQFLFPLPIIVLVFRRGIKVGVVAVIALFGLSLTFLPIMQALLIILQYCPLGLFLGYCFRHGKKPLFTLGLAAMIAAVGTALGLALSLVVSGLPVASLIVEANEMVVEMLQTLQDNGALERQLIVSGMDFEEYQAYIMGVVRKLLPAVMIMTAMFMTLVCYLISVAMLRRLRYDIPKLPPFSMWRIDWRITWGLILGLFLGWLGRTVGLPWMESIGDNITYIFGVVMFVSGVSLLFWLMKRKDLGIVIKAIIVVVMVQFFALAIYLVVLLAVLDALRDLRPWMAGKIEKSDRLRQQRRR